MADWTPNPAQPIATLSVANPVLAPITISFTKPQTQPQSYSIIDTDLPPEITKQANQNGVLIEGTFKNPWDYLKIEYIDKQNNHVVITKSQVKGNAKVIDYLPPATEIKDLLAMIYDPSQIRDYFITIECSYIQQSTGGAGGSTGGAGGAGGTQTPQTAQQTFIIRMINDFTGNKNMIASIVSQTRRSQ